MDAAHSKVVWCPGSKSGVWWKRNNPKLSYIMDLKKKDYAPNSWVSYFDFFF